MYTSSICVKNIRIVFVGKFISICRKLWVLPLIIVLLSGSYPTNKQIVGTDIPSLKKPVIFSATFSTTLQISGTPPLQSARSSGGGNATHLGKTSFEASSTVNFSVQPAQITGTATFTAANGDEFYTSFTGTTITVNGQAIGTFVHRVTSGTGRFEDINGLLTANSSHSLATQKGTLVFEGEIDY